MRNIIVFSNGEQMHFQYPKDHCIDVGYHFQMTGVNNQVFFPKVTDIQIDEEKRSIFYFLEPFGDAAQK